MHIRWSLRTLLIGTSLLLVAVSTAIFVLRPSVAIYGLCALVVLLGFVGFWTYSLAHTTRRKKGFA